jgi:hypothetical protein
MYVKANSTATMTIQNITEAGFSSASGLPLDKNRVSSNPVHFKHVQV